MNFYKDLDVDTSVSGFSVAEPLGGGESLRFSLYGGRTKGEVRLKWYEGRTKKELEGSCTCDWQKQYTFTLKGKTYIGRMRWRRDEDPDFDSHWFLDIYNSTGSRKICTAQFAGGVEMDVY